MIMNDSEPGNFFEGLHVNLDSNAENTIQKMSVTLSYENYVPEDIVDTIKSTAGVVGATIGI